MTKWSDHVKKYAKKHKMSYREASMDSKCKESYRKMSKKRMSPRKVSKKRMSPRKVSKKRMSRKMNAGGPLGDRGLDEEGLDLVDAKEIEPETTNVWIVVANDYKRGLVDDDWKPEKVDEIIAIFGSEQEAREKADDWNYQDADVGNGYRDLFPGTEYEVHGPFPKGMYEVYDTYVD